MRRITTWLLSTVSALVLLFSYHTSTSSSAAGVVALGSANAGSGTTDGSGSSGTTGSGSGSSGSGSSGSGSGDSGSSDSGTSDSGSSDSGSSDSQSGGSSSASGTFTGDAVMTRFGPVQVEITVKNGTITKSQVTQVPWNNGRDQQINSYAVPVLNDEAVQAQSAQIDMVSGATFTSEGYIQSLQSAIDQANL